MAVAAAAAAAAATAVDAGGRDGSLELSRTLHLSRKARSPDMRLAGVRRASRSAPPALYLGRRRAMRRRFNAVLGSAGDPES